MAAKIRLVIVVKLKAGANVEWCVMKLVEDLPVMVDFSFSPGSAEEDSKEIIAIVKFKANFDEVVEKIKKYPFVQDAYRIKKEMRY